MKKMVPFALVIMISTLLGCKKDSSDGTKSPALQELVLDGSASSAYYGTGIRQENYVAKAFISLSQQKTLSFAEAEQAQNELDMVCATSYFAGGIPKGTSALVISSMSDGSGWDTNTSDRTLESFGVKTKCYFKTVNVQQLTNITDLKTVADLDSLFARIDFKGSSEYQHAYANDASTAASGTAYNIAFQTESGRRGAFRLLNYSPNKPFTYKITVLMEPAK